MPKHLLVQHRKMIQICSLLVVLTVALSLFTSTAYAAADPLSVPNNKFGIHIISATIDEASAAASLVNSTGGDWGYITVLIESKDRNHNKWQEFFNDLRKRHLIPLVRLATKPVNEHWERPYDGEDQVWADFLDSLNWPTKNRYIIIYNEPNHATEWGNFVDPKSYAEILDKTIAALKTKNSDFFVLNGGFDASAPHKPPLYYDQASFMKQMDQDVPGIFNKLDGWVSHSYPNPHFSGSPHEQGRGTIRGYMWELQLLKSLGVKKDLPVFITETGWKHAEGLSYDNSLLLSETVADYFKLAYQNAWTDKSIVAVTPFLLNYQEAPFDHFSFRKIIREKQNALELKYPEYYLQYEATTQIPKIIGAPIQVNQASLVKGQIYKSLVSDQSYSIPFVFQNTGQSIWGERGEVVLKAIPEPATFVIDPAKLPKGLMVEPGKEAIFHVNFKAPNSGTYKVKLELYYDNLPVDIPETEFITEVKAPVVLKIKSALRWKQNHAGEYILSVASDLLKTTSKVFLNDFGLSDELEARYLLPDHEFSLTLQRAFYQAKSIDIKLQSGVNLLDFGVLQPDLLSALFKPGQFWKLLPFSN